jgi:hypothetical protein
VPRRGEELPGCSRGSEGASVVVMLVAVVAAVAAVVGVVVAARMARLWWCAVWAQLATRACWAWGRGGEEQLQEAGGQL